ncbi:putative reverse transcriptase domain-containing protein [Tanacetum coccineum]
MANVNHDDEVPVVEPNQHNDVPVVLEHVLEDEDEDSEEEDPQEDEDDMEVDIEEDKNKPELTYPYEETDSLNPPPPASESEPDDEIEVENPIEHEDETVPVSVYEVGESSTAAIPREDGDSVDQGTTAMERLVEKLDNVKEKAECKKLKKELEEAKIMPRKSAPMTQAVMRRMIKESVDAAIAVERERQAKVKNDASGSGPVRGQNTAPAVREFTFARFIKCNPTIFRGIEGAVELQRWFEKTESVFRISECAEGKKVRFVAATLEGPALTWWNSKVATLGLENVNQMPWTEMKQLIDVSLCPIEIQHLENKLWNLKVKEYNIVSYTQRMVEPERVKVDAYIRGLTNNIKGEVTLSKPANLSEAVCMAHKLMEQKSQARNERILEGKKQKWENHQGRNSSGKGNQKDNSRQTLQNNQKQGNARAMVTAPTDGKLPLCERCFNRHVGPCTIKCHKCEKVGHKLRYCKEKNVVSGANAQPIPTCYDCGEQGHTRNRCPKKVRYVVNGTFLLNNRYASILFDSGSDRSFVNTRFNSFLDIKPIKIEDSYEVELADGRIVSTNTVLKGCTFSLVNHIFEIDLMPIELGTFDVIIGMDWLVKHDAVIVCGEKVVRIPYENKMLIVEGDKGGSRLKIISCIKARKYVEQGCHLFLTHVTVGTY